jgi:2,4-dienoyl-CoA reductase (NADPH2)
MADSGGGVVANTEYRRLGEPATIGPMTVRNRVFIPAHSTNFAERVMSDRLVEYYLERARAGVGLIVQEPAIVHPSSLSRPTKVWAFDEQNIEPMTRAADALHAEGTRIVCQLLHNGAHMGSYFSGYPLWAPSEFFDHLYGEYSHEMTVGEIEEVVEGFAASAATVEAAGYDGIEIHASHGYLIQQFLSPLTNRRTDAYGGSADNRMRLLRDVIAAIRGRVGPGFAVGVRIAGTERAPGGLTEDDAVCLVDVLETDGRVDFVDVVSGSLAAEQWIVPDATMPRALNATVAGHIKASTKLPILVAGRIAEPAEAEAILADGQADLVGLARPFIADAHWLAKATAGTPAAIRPCTYCNECSTGIGRYRPIHCTVNPDMGHELERAQRRTPQTQNPPSNGSVTPAPRRVVVVGGGPAGMECALAAANDGHTVVLLEADDALGGQLRLGRSLAGRAEVSRIARYLADQLEPAGVDVRLGVGGTAETITALHPEVVVLATGSQAVPPVLPGTGEVSSADDVLRGGVEVGHRVVVCDHPGAGWAFEIVLEYLAAIGHHVMAVTAGPSLVPKLGDRAIFGRLAGAGVIFVPWSRPTLVEPGRVHLADTLRGDERQVEADSVVLATPRTSRSDLAAALAQSGLPVHRVGDGLSPRGLYEAIRDGRRVGRQVGGRVGSPA